MDYRLRKHESVPAGCQRIVCEEIASVLQEIHACSLGADPVKPIHDARKHLKKLRAITRLVRPAIGDESYLRETGSFRRVARRMATSRDAAVCVKTVEILQKDAPENLLPTLDAAHAFFSGALTHHRLPAHRTLDSISASLVETAASVRDWSFSCRCSKMLRKGMERIYRRARKAGIAAKETPSVELLHKWRMRTKEFWAVLRLFRGAENKRISRIEADAKELGDLLGKDHDLAVLKDILFREREAVGLSEEALVELEHHVETRRASLQRKSWELGEECYPAKPEKFVEAFLDRWEDWCGNGAR